MDGAEVACPACGRSIPAGKRFCGDCGAELSRICAACGAENPADKRFCGDCGTSLAATPEPGRSPAPLSSEERRLVTALFCDLVGFTPLAEQLDPEDVREVQRAYFGAMAEQIERYGGAVEKYAGDAVLALFGVPVAHEDDAERAVLCALEMQAALRSVAAGVRETWQHDLAIRIGVNTGEVVAGAWDAAGKQDVAVSGDTINTAARLQAAAEPGEVLVGAETMHLTRQRIEYRDPRPLILKGKAGTVAGYPAGRVRGRSTEPWEAYGQVAPFVGRERELAQLLEAWRRGQEGEGGIVTVVGEPGIGKSRLVAETVGRLATAGSPIRVIRARCLSYGQEISLWLVGDLIRDLCNIRETEKAEDIGAGLELALAPILEGRQAAIREEAIDVFGEVLGLPAGDSAVGGAGPAIRRQALVRSLRAVLGALAERSTVVLVLEDLHWIDRASEEALEGVLVDVPGRSVVVLITARPGWNPPWGGWGWPERIALRPLREPDAVVLAGAVLGGWAADIGLTSELRRYLAERAGGNPFFVEELLRALIEAGGIEKRNGQATLVGARATRLPSTLAEILLARLDRLESRAKGVAQVGSVIGRSFAVRLLAEVMECEPAALELPLTTLQQAEIAFPTALADPEYAFRHVTMREVAYSTLVARRRRELHLKTARSIAALYPNDEYAEMIAYHYTQTHAPEAASWLERAGDRAASVYASQAAVGYYRAASDRLGSVGAAEPALARVEEKLGEALYTVGSYDDAIDVLNAAIERYRRHRDLESAARATALLGRVHRQRGSVEEGIACVQPMIELLGPGGSARALTTLHIALAHLYMPLGRYPEMLSAAEQGSALARTLGDERLIGEVEMRRGTALAQLGRVEEARHALEASLPLVQAGGDLTTLFITLSNLGAVLERQGAIDDMRRYTEQALTVAERLGNPGRLCHCLANLGRTLITLGDWEGAQMHLERAVALAKEVGDAPDAAWGLQSMGNLLLRRGDFDEARGYLQAALGMAERIDARQAREVAAASLAELELLTGQPEAAIERLEPLAAPADAELGELLPTLVRAYLARDDVESVRRAEQTGERLLAWARDQPTSLVEACWVWGLTLTRLGRHEEADHTLHDALVLARRLPFPYAEARVLLVHGGCYAAQGEAGRAAEALDQALTIFRRLGAKEDAVRVEAMLAAVG
ncbi:MAG TPA: tetratricopeptide repeat protein [Chloroflexota bacterium]|nr:tetratricopeptide repeat protein [Chloroflexota bacterium]